MKRRALLTRLALPAVAAATAPAWHAAPAAADPATEDVISGFDRHAAPLHSTEPYGDLADLAPFGRMVTGASIVGLGEATHNSHQFFTMKHRAFRYLAKTAGFGLFCQEVHVGAGLRIDDYVRHGRGDIQQIMREEFQSGTRLWHTREYLNLFEWMRAHNRKHPHQLGYAGNDIDYPAEELFARVLRHARPHLTAKLTALYEGLRPTTDMNTWMSVYPNGPLTNRRANAARARQALDLLTDSGPGRYTAAHEQAIHCARAIWQVATLWAYDLTALDEIKAALRHRELSMAQNTIQAQRTNSTKVLLSAHNLHVAYQSVEPQFRPDMQGTFLRQALGPRYASAGFTFHHGSFNASPDSEPLRRFTIGPPPADHNEHTLDQVRHCDFILDTRHLPAPARAWLTQPRPTRAIGATYPTPSWPMALGNCYDLVIHLHHVTAAHLLDSTDAP